MLLIRVYAVLTTKEPSSQEEDQPPPSPTTTERTDQEYVEWKNWRIRDKERQEQRRMNLESAAKKEKCWDLYRECRRIMQENKVKWLERKEEENLKRLETEKQERLAIAGHKKGQRARMIQENENKKKKKETKLESSRRLEEKKRLEGKQRMKSGLWKQRREKDGSLVNIWKELKTEHEQKNGNGNPRHEEEDPWMEEISLTVKERKKLMELEKSYLTSIKLTNYDISSNQPPGTSSHEDQKEMTIDAATPQISQTSSKISPSVSQSESPTYVSQASSSITRPVTNLETPIKKTKLFQNKSKTYTSSREAKLKRWPDLLAKKAAQQPPLSVSQNLPLFPLTK